MVCMKPDKIEAVMHDLAETLQEKQRITEQENHLRSELLILMQDEKIEKLENGSIRVRYMKGFERATVDANKLKQECPEIFRRYSKKSSVAPFVKVQVL